MGGNFAAATKLMALMGLGVKQGDAVFVTVEGGTEKANAAAMEQFFKDNLSRVGVYAGVMKIH